MMEIMDRDGVIGPGKEMWMLCDKGSWNTESDRPADREIDRRQEGMVMK